MKKEMEQYAAILRQSYDAQEEYIREMRGIKHDIQAHMIVLQYYLEEGSYDRAKAYLKEMQAHQNRVKRVYVDTGNNMVNAVLAERWKQSDAEIEVSCFGTIPVETDISEYDLCTIFSNLFSNAVEACEKLKEQKKEICIEIGQQEEYWCIMVSNPIEWCVDRAILGKSSSKEDKAHHGFGLSNVIHTVKKNKGKIEFEITERSFITRISLPFLSKNNKKSLPFLSESDGN